MFIVQGNLPYYVKDDFKVMYPCEIDAFSYNVDFKSPLTVVKVDCVMTDSEIRAKFGIFAVDGWDKTNNKIKKISNKTVSSKVGTNYSSTKK